MAAIRINDPLTAEQLRAILEYDPETGIFVWRHRAECPKYWNTRYADKPAGTVVGTYRIIIIEKRKYVASRLAWLWFYGKWPIDFVDHANGNKQDDRISNLRAATKSQNTANVGAPTHNTSGLKGVSWDKRRGKWRAQICYQNKRRELGLFNTASEAHKTYCDEAVRLHGVFARFE
jgi:hypothetical protein